LPGADKTSPGERAAKGSLQGGVEGNARRDVSPMVIKGRSRVWYWKVKSVMKSGKGLGGSEESKGLLYFMWK